MSITGNVIAYVQGEEIELFLPLDFYFLHICICHMVTINNYDILLVTIFYFSVFPINHFISGYSSGSMFGYRIFYDLASRFTEVVDNNKTMVEKIQYSYYLFIIMVGIIWLLKICNIY